MGKRGASIGQSLGRNTETGQALLHLLERIEKVREEKKALGDDEKAIFAEAKAQGFDTKIMRATLKVRDAEPGKLQEARAHLDIYLHAIGMEQEAPLHRIVGLMNVDLAARDEVIATLKLLAPEHGDIVLSGKSGKIRVWRDRHGVVHAEELEPEEREERDAATLTH